MVETDANNGPKKCCACCACFRRKKSNSESEETRSDPLEEALPYVGDVEDLRVGLMLSVAGYVQKGCNRFSINLTCGTEPNADIAFHFNPRMEQKYVVRNCRINGHWGQEETTTVMKFDFHVGKRFKIDIFVAEREFMVSVNGHHWCAFNYRVPLKNITNIEVRGGVEIQEVSHQLMMSYPECKDTFPTIPINSDKEEELPMPYTGLLPRPLTLGWELDITGRIKMLPKTFYINLQDGTQLWPHPTIPLHLNPRFSVPDSTDVFVRNAWSGGSWGPEERAPGFPFLAGTRFTMLIKIEENCFTVWIDGKLTGEFQFRIATENINSVYISGDVFVYNITMRQNKKDVKIRFQ